MQGSVETFFKIFDELKRSRANVDFSLIYKTFWILEVSANGKLIFNIKGQDTNSLFDLAATKLFNYLREQ